MHIFISTKFLCMYVYMHAPGYLKAHTRQTQLVNTNLHHMFSFSFLSAVHFDDLSSELYHAFNDGGSRLI